MIEVIDMDIKNQNARLSHFLDSQTNSNFRVDVSAMAQNSIEKNRMQCFYKRYRTIGGESLPKDVVNMAIQRAKLPRTIETSGSIQRSIFSHISEQFEEMNIHSSREVWRLSNIVSKEEYGFTVPFLTWYLARVIRLLSREK